MKHKYQILLLLFVIILFSVLGSFSIYEGNTPQQVIDDNNQGGNQGGTNCPNLVNGFRVDENFYLLNDSCNKICGNTDAAGNTIDAYGNILNKQTCERIDSSCNYIDSFGYSRSWDPSEVDGNCNLKTNPNKIEQLRPRATGITCDIWDSQGNRLDNCGNIVDASCNRICNIYDTNNYRIDLEGNRLDSNCERIDSLCNYIDSTGTAKTWSTGTVDANCRHISFPTPDVNDPNMYVDPPPIVDQPDGNWDSNWDSNWNDNNFILKSEIVPPVCPACPPFIGNGGLTGGGLTGDGTTGTPYDGTIMSKNEESQSNQKNMNYSFEQTIETKNNDSNNGFNFPNFFNSNDENDETDSNNLNNKKNSNNQNTPNNSNNLNNSNDLQSNSGGLFNSFGNEIDDYKNEIEELKEKLEQLKMSSGSCPPCPACERCPEPSFDCKKVPNYRSTSVGDYLPMPILNDFSRFS